MLETINGLDVTLACLVPLAYLLGLTRGFRQGVQHHADTVARRRRQIERY